jgi:hypothetical protein
MIDCQIEIYDKVPIEVNLYSLLICFWGADRVSIELMIKKDED